MRRILVIRAADEFSRISAASGFEIINLPLIKTKPLDDLSDFEAKLKTVEKYDGIFLTSQNAARILAHALDESNINFLGKVYVLGKRSFEILRSKSLNLIFFETANTAGEMLEKIPAEDLAGKEFLFIRGEKSLRVVPDFLESLATVDETIVYETRRVAVGIEKINALRGAFKAGEIAAACFFSPSQAASFLEQFGAEILHQTRIATIGETTAEFFERRNLPVDFVAPKATAEDFAVGLVEYLKKEN